jgi:hypothetical protein
MRAIACAILLAPLAALAQEVQSSGSDGYTPPADSQPALRILGYVDLGWARATGNGTSFAPGDTRIPADYGVDTFAPAVNSRGDVASTDSGGRFTNGFLPRSMGIGGRPSFFISTVDVDLRYTSRTAPLLLFTRLQLLPRFSSQGESTRVLAEQAFARLIPFSSQELAVSVGKFDSVFGIEYLENEANLRTGVTPSLIARYTTGQSLGAKAFYRFQIPKLWTALSLNVAATNGGTLVDTLQPQNASLTGTPVFSGRFGIEINLPAIEIKFGVSALDGPRNDQSQPGVRQKALGADARIVFGPVELRGEGITLRQDAGAGDKVNGLGTQTVVSRFEVQGGYAQLALGFDFAGPLRRFAVYGRYDRRHAQFEGYVPITVDRITAGARADLFENLALKGEVLKNRELAGAPSVDNDVITSSLVYSW